MPKNTDWNTLADAVSAGEAPVLPPGGSRMAWLTVAVITKTGEVTGIGRDGAAILKG